MVSTNFEFNAAIFGIGQEKTPGSPARATLSYGRLITNHHAHVARRTRKRAR